MMKRNFISVHRFARMQLAAARSASGASENAQLSASPKPSPQQEWEAAAREDRLDFTTATKILFSEPAKPRRFGLDFHIVQFVLACMPSLAVYLVAMYARSEMRKMEKDREAGQAERDKKNPPPQALISDLKVRVEAIEGVVQELKSEVAKTVTAAPAKEIEQVKQPTEQVQKREANIEASASPNPSPAPSQSHAAEQGGKTTGGARAERGNPVKKYERVYGDQDRSNGRPAYFNWSWAGRRKSDTAEDLASQAPSEVRTPADDTKPVEKQD